MTDFIYAYLFLGCLFGFIHIVTLKPTLIFEFIKYIFFFWYFIPRDVWKEMKKDTNF